MQKSINHTFFYAQTPQAVWEYLTNAELMAQWLMPNDFQPIIGYDFQFKTKPIPSLNFDGIVYCKVLEILPLKKLSYSWKTGPGDGAITIDSLVVWKLQSKGEGTELVLEHTGFKENEYVDMFNALNGGWLQNIQKIAKLLNEKHGTTNA